MTCGLSATGVEGQSGPRLRRFGKYVVVSLRRCLQAGGILAAQRSRGLPRGLLAYAIAIVVAMAWNFGIKLPVDRGANAATKATSDG